jgi:predicted nucleic acid-binding protein
MPVNLSIKNAPAHIVERRRQRAARNHRSLQGRTDGRHRGGRAGGRVDASALAALLCGEPEGEAVSGRLGDAHPVAPNLIAFELANVCLIKTRRHPAQGPALMAASAFRRRLVLEEVAVDHDATLDLAVRTGRELSLAGASARR